MTIKEAYILPAVDLHWLWTFRTGLQRPPASAVHLLPLLLSTPRQCKDIPHQHCYRRPMCKSRGCTRHRSPNKIFPIPLLRHFFFNLRMAHPYHLPSTQAIFLAPRSAVSSTRPSLISPPIIKFLPLWVLCWSLSYSTLCTRYCWECELYAWVDTDTNHLQSTLPTHVAWQITGAPGFVKLKVLAFDYTTQSWTSTAATDCSHEHTHAHTEHGQPAQGWQTTPATVTRSPRAAASIKTLTMGYIQLKSLYRSGSSDVFNQGVAIISLIQSVKP